MATSHITDDVVRVAEEFCADLDKCQDGKNKNEENVGKSAANYLKDSTATIKFHKKSSKIPVKKSVTKGNTISPKLFTTCLQKVFKKLKW